MVNAARALLMLGAVATTAAAQVQMSPEMQEAMRRNQEMYAPYFECVRTREKEMQLYNAAGQVRQMVEIRERLRSAPPGNAEVQKIRAEYLAQSAVALPQTFQHYRALGGTAATPDQVTVPPTPCPTPIRLERPQAGGATVEQRSPIRLERSIPILKPPP